MPNHDFRIRFDCDQHLAGDHQPGTSPGYLFLHGMGSARTGEKSDSLMQHAARRGVSCTRCDLRGHGESSGVIGHVTIGELIDDAIRVLERIGPSVIVGSSLGGLIGAFAATRRRQLVTGLALIAPALGFLDRLERLLDDEGRMRVSDGRTFVLHDRVFANAKRLDERALPRELDVPTLIVHGDNDEIVPLSRSRRFHAAIPHERKELWIVPGGDHRLSTVTDEMWPRLDALLDNQDD